MCCRASIIFNFYIALYIILKEIRLIAVTEITLIVCKWKNEVKNKINYLNMLSFLSLAELNVQVNLAYL